MSRDSQRAKVYAVLKDRRWHDHQTITARCGAENWASASARLRDLRKDRYGGYRIHRKPNPAQPGFWLYRMVDPS